MFWFLFKEISEGKSLARAYMHEETKNIELDGTVSDVGAGGNPEYHDFFKRGKNLKITKFDLNERRGTNIKIDLEKDSLPYESKKLDAVLLFNVLEHIFNYNHLVVEIERVIKNGGRLIGYVPFLVNYHPDPHDYFRYTEESLEKIMKTAGFRDVVIRPTGAGPFAVQFNVLMLSIPKVLRLILFPFFYFLDVVFLYFRPETTKRVPLGYMFVATK